MSQSFSTAGQTVPLSNHSILPFGNEKIDIFLLFNRVYPRVTKWLDQFFAGNAWETDLHGEFQHTDILRHFYFESRSKLRTSGEQTFGFGFPTLIDRDEQGKVVMLPIYIWYLGIKPQPNRRDAWLINFDDTHPIIVNEAFLDFIQTKYKLNLQKMLQEPILQKNFSLKSLDLLTKNLARQFSFTNPDITSGLRELPTGKRLEDLAVLGDIIWGGALGLFEHHKINHIATTEGVQSFENEPISIGQVHEFSLLQDNPEQHDALRLALRNRLTVVEAPHGAGKTYLAANILLNALSNGQKTVVVARDVATLMEIQHKFVALGLGTFTFLLKDLLYDKNLLLDTLRTEQQIKTVVFDAEDFRLSLNLARRWNQRLFQQHEALSRPIFGTDTWEEVVGKFLEVNRQTGKELLANHLNSADFEFKKEEYDSLIAAIEQAQTLYSKAKTLRHPLTVLHNSVFEGKVEVRKQWVKEKLNTYLDQITHLQHGHIVEIERFTEKLTNFYEAHFRELSGHLQNLKEGISDYIFQYGEEFETASSSWLVISSPFSDKSSGILRAKERLLEEYDALEKAFLSREYRYFDHIFLKLSDAKNITRLKHNLENFEISLQGWRLRLAPTVQEQVQRLSAKTAQYFENQSVEDIENLEKDLDTLLENINTSKILEQPLTHKMLTLTKRLQFIESTAQFLDETNQNLRDFDEFFDWQKSWLALSEKGKRLVTALVKVKPKDWQTAFESWYFYHVLTANYDVDIPENNERFDKVAHLTEKLRLVMTSQIASHWNTRKATAIKAVKTLDRDIWNIFFSSKGQQLAKDKPLSELLKNGLKTLTEMYPVLLMTPSVANTLLGKHDRVFNLMLFENSQNLQVIDTQQLVQHTDRAVMLAERSAIDGLTEGSLISFAKKQHAAEAQLTRILRPAPSAVAMLNEAAFYPNSIFEAHQFAIKNSVNFVQVSGGRFDEARRTNEAEASEVIRILKDVEEIPQKRVFPRVGIVTQTIEQRNLIGSQLLTIVQKNLHAWERIQQMQQSGTLSIFHVSELQGQRFDLVIMSGTFANMEQLELSATELRSAFNCFTQKLWWITSFSNETLKEVSNHTTNNVKTLLANTLLLLQQSDATDTPQYYEQLTRLRTRYAPFLLPKVSTFCKELADMLEKRGTPRQRILLNYEIFAGVRVPLILKALTNDEKNVVVRVDGAFGNNRFFNTDRELNIAERLKAENFRIADVWTYEFWKNPTKALEKAFPLLVEHI